MARFVFANVLLIPLIILIVTVIFAKNPPKEINNMVGYRTPASKASQEAWDYANAKCIEFFKKYSIISIAISAIVLVVLWFACKDMQTSTATVVLLVIIAVQVAGLMLVVPVVESGLKKL